jgi:hypothetical protein
MFGKFRTAAIAGAVAASAFATTAAQADGWIVGLIDGKSIVTIDPASRKVASTVAIQGAGPVLGIDVRPADGMLYGIAGDGTIVTIDVKSGTASKKSKLSDAWKKTGNTTFDFNPAADRLRLMSSEGISLRINVDDGKTTVDGSHNTRTPAPARPRRLLRALTPIRSRARRRRHCTTSMPRPARWSRRRRRTTVCSTWLARLACR